LVSLSILNLFVASSGLSVIASGASDDQAACTQRPSRHVQLLAGDLAGDWERRLDGERTRDVFAGHEHLPQYEKAPGT
jgi:hypothetical protein